MSEGLVTRVGLWIDRKWESKVTEGQLEAYGRTCEARHSEELGKASMAINLVKAEYDDNLKVIEGRLDVVIAAMKSLDEAQDSGKLEKEIVDIKTRIEKMEVYAGMKRLVDPTKAAVAKSAFSM